MKINLAFKSGIAVAKHSAFCRSLSKHLTLTNMDGSLQQFNQYILFSPSHFWKTSEWRMPTQVGVEGVLQERKTTTSAFYDILQVNRCEIFLLY